MLVCMQKKKLLAWPHILALLTQIFTAVNFDPIVVQSLMDLPLACRLIGVCISDVSRGTNSCMVVTVILIFSYVALHARMCSGICAVPQTTPVLHRLPRAAACRTALRTSANSWMILWSIATGSFCPLMRLKKKKERKKNCAEVSTSICAVQTIVR